MIKTSVFIPKKKFGRWFQNLRYVATTKRRLKGDENKSSLKSWNEIPGPRSLPIIGNLLQFLPGGNLHGKLGYKLHDHLYKTYGPISKLSIFPNPPIVFMFDPEAIAQVSHGENLNPIRPSLQSLEYYRKKYNKKTPENKEMFQNSTGLITEHGKEWKDFRSMANPVLLHPDALKPYYSALNEVSLDLVRRIKCIRNGKNMVPTNFNFEINKWSLESVSIVALGTRLGCLKEDFDVNSPAGRLIKVVNKVHRVGMELDFTVNLWKFYPTNAYKRAMAIYDEQVSLTRYFIRQSIKDMTNKSKSTTKISEEKGVLEKLLEIDENVAVIMANDLLVGGVDATTHAMLPALYLLAKNPDKQDILREEISTNKERKYMRAVFKECFRVMPAVNGNFRKTRNEYDLLGYRIPKNTSMFFCNEYISLMDTQYPKPKEFIPERWIVGKEDPFYYGNAQNFGYLPFGFGTRQCIGKRLVQLEFEVLLSRLVENFRVGWDGPEPTINPSAINYFDGPYCFTFKDV